MVLKSLMDESFFVRFALLHFYVLSLQRTKGIDYEIFGSQG